MILDIPSFFGYKGLFSFFLGPNHLTSTVWLGFACLRLGN